jgi:hypothetical protein
LSDDKPSGDVVTHRRNCGEGMKKLVMAECVRPRVRPAKAVEDKSIGGPDMQAMRRLLNGAGYRDDIPAMHSANPDIAWTSFADWA